MPASKHTKKATTPKLKRMWEHVRSQYMDKGASAGKADMIANGVVKKASRGKKRGG